MEEIDNNQPANKRLLFVHNSREFGGAEKHLLDLIEVMSGSGVQMSILCMDSDFFTERLSAKDHNRVDVIRIAGQPKFRQWTRLLRAARADSVVFIGGCLWNFPWYVAMVGFLAGISSRFLIAHLPPPPPPEKIPGWSPAKIARRLRRRRHLTAIKFGATFFTRTVCVSNQIRRFLVSEYQFPNKRTVVIHNGVRLAEFDSLRSIAPTVRRHFGVGAEDFLVVCVARLSEQKALNILIDAMGKVAGADSHCKCIIVGEGPLRAELEAQVLALGLANLVFFTGFQQDVRPYLAAANAFTLTSRNEGLPLSVLEAMAAGLPCVVTDVGGNSEIITDGVEGRIVPSGSVAAVADAITALIQRPQICSKMSSQARKKVKAEFDLLEQMTQIAKVLLDKAN
jgi:glycosyltransferase involved in cell wall biosynthesis